MRRTLPVPVTDRGIGALWLAASLLGATLGALTAHLRPPREA